LHDRLAAIAPAALQDALRQLATGTAARTAQNTDEATYAPKLEREHGQIDWSQTAEAIERKIRAFNPWPGTYSMVVDSSGKQRKLKIFSAAVAQEDAAPGAIVADEGLVVGTSDRALRLSEVQLEGKKRMNAVEFVRGHPWIASARAVSFSFPTPQPSA
jgi:methionyl-tRNA formyltransferase